MSREVGLSIAILAGGESRRMGRDKASLPVVGRPMLVRVLDAAIATGLPVAVIGRSDIAPPKGWHDGVPCIADEAPGSGPLGAIATALRATGGTVLGVACDMPFLTSDALLWLANLALSASDRHGVVALNGGRREPLFSAYSPRALPLIASLSARGERALHALIAAGDFLHVDLPPVHAGALLNINTPDDLRRVERDGMDDGGSRGR